MNDLINFVLKKRRIKKLFNVQMDVVNKAMITKNNLVISLPTGSGKSLIAEIIVLKTILKDKGKCVYLSPLKAIAEEKFEEFSRYYRDKVRVGIFTGDYTNGGFYDQKVNGWKYDLLIMTPERFDSIIRSWRNNEWLNEIELVAIDEFHMLGLERRGAKLEALILRFRKINPFSRFIVMSATLSNIDEIGTWLGGITFKSTWRPVKLKKRIIRYEDYYDKINKLIREINNSLSKKEQILVFVNSRKKAENLAKYISKNLKKNLMKIKIVEKRWFEEFFEKNKDLIENGILYHHAGLNKNERNFVESLFKNKMIYVLFSTTTLSWGVNFPVDKAIIFDIIKFNQKGFDYFSNIEIEQMLGRSGRPFQKKGDGVIFIPKWDKNSEKIIKGELEPIRSQLFEEDNLIEQVLVEISSGIIKTKNDLIHGFLLESFGSVKSTLKDYDLEKILNHLEIEGFIFYDPEYNRYLPTRFGKVVSGLCISPTSSLIIRRFIEKIDKPSTYDILFLICYLRECEPKIRANFEDLEKLSEKLLDTKSFITTLNLNELEEIFTEINPKRLLSTIKSSLILFDRINEHSKEEIAEFYEVYQTDIDRLIESADWLLHSFKIISSVMRKKDLGELAKRIQLMIRYGYSGENLEMLLLPHIGVKRLKKLVVKDLVKIKGLGKKQVLEIIEKAKELCQKGIKFKTPIIEYSLTNYAINKFYLEGVDIYRLKRSFELEVLPMGNYWIVKGGGNEHIVKKEETKFICDCKDFERISTQNKQCKHILAVRRYVEDENILKIIKRIREIRKEKNIRYKPLIEILDHLWLLSGEKNV